MLAPKGEDFKKFSYGDNNLHVRYAPHGSPCARYELDRGHARWICNVHVTHGHENISTVGIRLTEMTSPSERLAYLWEVRQRLKACHLIIKETTQRGITDSYRRVISEEIHEDKKMIEQLDTIFTKLIAPSHTSESLF